MWRLIGLIFEFFETVNRGMTAWDFMIFRIVLIITVTSIGAMYVIKGLTEVNSLLESRESIIERYHPNPGKLH